MKKNMLKLFNPKVYVEDFTKLNIEKLKNQGIKLLVCDIDNTLVAHDEAHPNETVVAFIRNIQEQGMKIYLVSNNHHERVHTFAKELQVPCYAFAKKPLKKTYRKIIKDSGFQPHEIAAIGDQLLTDVLGANRMGMVAMLTKPLVQKDLKVTKFNRQFENMIYRQLQRKNKLTKGEYYD